MGISSATVWVVSELLKTLAILSGTTARRSAVDWEDLKPYWKSGEGNLIFCCTDSQENYFGSVGRQNNDHKFPGRHFKKDIDYRGRDTCAIFSLPIQFVCLFIYLFVYLFILFIYLLFTYRWLKITNNNLQNIKYEIQSYMTANSA